MEIESGDMTVGDANVPLDFTTNEDMTGMSIYFKFGKPSGETFERAASSISTMTARYITVLDEFDEDGDWMVGLKNMTNNYEYKDVKRMKVRPRFEDMAVAR